MFRLNRLIERQHAEFRRAFESSGVIEQHVGAKAVKLFHKFAVGKSSREIRCANCGEVSKHVLDTKALTQDGEPCEEGGTPEPRLELRWICKSVAHKGARKVQSRDRIKSRDMAAVCRGWW